MGTNPEYQNRLIHEKSPYLLQHAANPVDWYPWGQEAFARAIRENKPILLSIGYSSCHWCHVMAHESFESEEIARMMNDSFVCVKVDREERPDVDHIYMTAAMAMTGQGGWPLTVFLTPDRKPFWGGTYFPPYARGGAPGLMDVLRSIHSAWQNDPQQVIRSGENFTALIRANALKLKKGGTFDRDILSEGFTQFCALYDSQHGGFGTSPKFPSSHNLSFLLRYWKRAKNTDALPMVEGTLRHMAGGGIYDHLGGGFHRYATDQRWQVPHFEKMLYDQAMLVKTYLEAWQISKSELYAQVARGTCDYILRDMQHHAGGFYSAEDADSVEPEELTGNPVAPGHAHNQGRKEGAFYLWRYAEIERVLGENDAAIFNYHYGIERDGNALADPHGEFAGKNILAVVKTLTETSGRFEKTPREIETIVARCRQKLFECRRARPRPFLDDKILVDWNGLMISALALGSRILREPRYRTAARKAADFIIRRLMNKDGRLCHRYRDGQAAVPGTLGDYAFFIQGLLDLYEATFEPGYLQYARKLSDVMINLFWDNSSGGFYLTADDAEEILFRPKEVYDGAIPSGNSVAALNLVRLYHITLEKNLREKFEKLFEAFSAEVSHNPAAYGQMLMAVDFALGPSCEIVVAGDQKDPQFDVMLAKIHDYFIPNKVIIHRPPSSDAAPILAISPFIGKQTAVDGNPTVYVCVDHACRRPITDMTHLQESLSRL